MPVFAEESAYKTEQSTLPQATPMSVVLIMFQSTAPGADLDEFRSVQVNPDLQNVTMNTVLPANSEFMYIADASRLNS